MLASVISDGLNRCSSCTVQRGCRRLSTRHASLGAGGYKLSHPAFLWAPFKGVSGGLCRLGCARHLLLAYCFLHFAFSCLSMLSLLLSAKLPYTSFQLNVTLPCQGLVEASWSTHGIGIGIYKCYLNSILWEILSFFTSSIFTSICGCLKLCFWVMSVVVGC